MKRRISAIQQIDGTLLGIVLSVIYLRRKIKKLSWEGRCSQRRSGEIEVRNQGPDYFIRRVDAECPAASQHQPRIRSVPLSSAGESIKDLPLLFPGTVPQT
jgi:hypothetical protein